MPKKKSKVANFLKKRSSKKNEAIKTKAKRNPSTVALKELGGTVGVGVGAYVANRIAAGVAQKALAGRIPLIGSHIGPITSFAVASLIWYLAEKIDWLRRYGNSALVGSAVAFFQVLLGRYMPGVELLLDASSRAPGLGEYIEEDEPTALPGQSLMDNKLISAVTSEDDDAELMTGVFARN